MWVVTHPGTIWAQRCLTWVIKWHKITLRVVACASGYTFYNSTWRTCHVGGHSSWNYLGPTLLELGDQMAQITLRVVACASGYTFYNSTAHGVLVMWVDTHPGTIWAQRCLTSVIKWVPVCPTWHVAVLWERTIDK
jgi:hypothetical protein